MSEPLRWPFGKYNPVVRVTLDAEDVKRKLAEFAA